MIIISLEKINLAKVLSVRIVVISLVFIFLLINCCAEPSGILFFI